MWRVVKKILKMSDDKAGAIKASILSAFIYSIFMTFPYIAVYLFFGPVTSGHDELTLGVIWKCVAVFAIGLVGASIAKIVTYRLQEWSGNYVAAKLRIEIGEHLKRVPMGFFSEKSLGDITTALTSDITFLENNAVQILDWIINGCISAVMSSVFLMLFDFKLGLIFFAGVIIALILMQRIQVQGGKNVVAKKQAETKAISVTLEFIRGISVFKLFHMGGNSIKHMEESYREFRDQSCNLELQVVPLSTILRILLKLATTAILLLTPYQVINGTMDISVGVLMLVAIFNLFGPIETMATASGVIRALETTIDRIDEIKEFSVLEDKGKSVNFRNFDIEFDNVSFSYEAGRDVLSNISFQIPQNSMTAFIGASGSGKTTLTRLIARFWDVDSGAIKIGGINIKDISCDNLLNYISIVFQNVYLFNDTIANNIKYGNPNATQEMVEEAARKARCHDFIQALPDGYNTMVGESGSHLSGGEKQRISIARAILKDAPIVLLDEATSNIDPDNEVYIQEAINELVKDKTLIVIAHRLNTIKGADQIVVLDEGKVIEKGDHDELTNRKNGQYKKFWEIEQMAGRWKIAAD